MLFVFVCIQECQRVWGVAVGRPRIGVEVNLEAHGQFLVLGDVVCVGYTCAAFATQIRFGIRKGITDSKNRCGLGFLVRLDLWPWL